MAIDGLSLYDRARPGELHTLVETKAGKRLPHTIHRSIATNTIMVVVDWPAADSDQPVPDVHSLDEVVRAWSHLP